MKLIAPQTRTNSFQSLPLAPALFVALEKMDISKPTEVQSFALPAGLSGLDLIAIAQTGSGKTLAYALPLLTHLANQEASRGLIMAPSREMAQQIQKVIEALSAELPISCSLIIGGVAGAKQTKALKKQPKLIVATPGRLNDHLAKNKLLLQNVDFIVIDEADRMLDMGFAPQLKKIQSTLRGPRQTMMFSASFGSNVESVAKIFMKPAVTMVRTEKAEAPVGSLKQKVLFIDHARKHDRLLDELNATRGGVIVFTRDKDGCWNLGQYLKEYGYAVDLIHGDLSHGHRNRVIRDFRSEKIRIVVATDLLARGLDVPHVDHVINFDLPFEAEDFLHRIGRTARAGRSGTAITFVTPNDEKKYRSIQVYLKDAEEIKVDPKFKFLERKRSDKYADAAKFTSTRASGPIKNKSKAPDKHRRSKIVPKQSVKSKKR